MQPDEPRHARRFGVLDDELLFTFFGYGYPTKGIETLIAAFGLMVDRHPKWKLMFAVAWILHLLPMAGHTRLLCSKPPSRGNRGLIQSEYDAFTDEGSTFLRAADICVLPFDSGIQLNNSSVAGRERACVADYLNAASRSGIAFC